MFYAISTQRSCLADLSRLAGQLRRSALADVERRHHASGIGSIDEAGLNRLRIGALLAKCASLRARTSL
jgi:hypothetical protein